MLTGKGTMWKSCLHGPYDYRMINGPIKKHAITGEHLSCLKVMHESRHPEEQEVKDDEEDGGEGGRRVKPHLVAVNPQDVGGGGGGHKKRHVSEVQSIFVTLKTVPNFLDAGCSSLSRNDELLIYL